MNAKCREIRPTILAVADGEATAQEKAAVESHVETCPECRRALEGLGAMPVDFGQPVVPGPVLETMRLELHARLDALDRPRAPAGGLLSWLFQGTLVVPKPLAWATLVAIVVLSTARLSSPVEPAASGARPRLAPVILDGVDRAGPFVAWGQG